VIRYAIRILRGLTGVTLKVEGLEHMPPAEQTCVLVANHISYLDTLALIDALPRDFVYVAKREFVERFDTRVFLARLDTLFAERFDPRRGVADSRSFVASARGGRSLAFYPEGTFRREPGLLPFRMGAFVTAAEAEAAVVPVTIRGTRDILGAETWLPSRHPVRVVIDRPVQPEGPDWGAAVRLRDEVRSIILNRTGEPDLQRAGR
jgi:1-acyl-sn-glycerol-3-phosphate acyltransferase